MDAVKRVNTKCPNCNAYNNDIFTYCPYCLSDTAGEAICITCDSKIYQLDYWKNENFCPKCNSEAAIHVYGERNLYSYLVNFKGNYDKAWKTKTSFLYGSTKIEQNKFIIRNKWGLKWNNWIELKGLILNKPFLVKTEIELLSLKESSHFGILIGDTKSHHEFIFNKKGLFRIRKIPNKNKEKLYIGGNKIEKIGDWIKIPNFNPTNRPTILLEIFYNKKNKSIYLFINGIKAAFCLEHEFTSKNPSIGFSTSKQSTCIGINSLLVRNYPNDYIY